MHLMVVQGDVGQVEARFGPFVHSVNLEQDRGTVCVEFTTGMETILGAANGTPR
jgi:hypothetical protein